MGHPVEIGHKEDGTAAGERLAYGSEARTSYTALRASLSEAGAILPEVARGFPANSENSVRIDKRWAPRLTEAEGPVTTQPRRSSWPLVLDH